MVEAEEMPWEVKILGSVNNLIHGILPIIVMRYLVWIELLDLVQNAYGSF